MPRRFFRIIYPADKRFLSFAARHAIRLVSLLLLSLHTAFSEQLAIKNFSISEGLARNQITFIYPDSRGYIWIGTTGGLSRFDGYGFTNYGTRHGLPNPVISGIAETENGVFWVATHGGLCLIDFNQPLDENGKLKLQIVPVGDAADSTVFSILLNEQKTLLAGTRDGIFKIYRTESVIKSERLSLGGDYLPRREGIGNFVEDLSGNLWISNPNGFFRIDKAGKVTRYELAESEYFDRLGSIALDEKGRLWIGGLGELYVVKPTEGDEKLKRIDQSEGSIKLPENAGEFAVLSEKHGLPDKKALEIFRSSDNKMWIATRRGAAVFDGAKFQTLTAKNGLISDEILCFGEDGAGNLWLGTESTGAMRAARNGFTSYTTADGLPDNRIVSVFEGSDGNIYATDGNRNISRFDGDKFVSVRPRFPSEITGFGWSWQQPVRQDSFGEWWIATAQGLLRYPKIKRLEELAVVSPSNIYDSSNGLPGNQIFRIFEDSRGDIWISNFSPPSSGISRLERPTGKIHNLPNFSQEKDESVSAYSYAEDGHGNLWLGLTDGKLARYRNGTAQLIENIENQPATNIYDMMRDRSGNIWMATGSGAFYMETFAAENPVFTPLTTENGLATDDIIAVTDDFQGRIYFATSQGVSRYNAETKRIESFTTDDGIANSELRSALRDRNGNLWFGSVRGLTRFEPSKLKESDSPAPVLIRSVRAGARAVPLGELGQEIVSGIELAPDQNNLEIEVIGLSQQSGETLKYQYRLGGEDWSEPTVQRKFTLVGLLSGNYRFEARAINSAGLISPNSATISFSVLAPFYRRWWFISAMVLIVCGLAYLFYRSRLKRLRELEKIRYGIATDLHDDIGASLSQISLVSEVLALKNKDASDEDKESLKTIAQTSRNAVGAMSEMVWAINPRRDNLPDTVQRMRHFAGDILTSAGIKFTFISPALDREIKIDADTRRHLYLIFKEIINNAVKYSGATEISITFSRFDKTLMLTVKDNGHGFNPSEKHSGNGLTNIRFRAEKIGGKLDVISDNGKGTSVVLEIPYRTRNFRKIAT